MSVPRPAELYRLPWSLNDNVLAWLEPTKRCNLYCEGCYSRNDPRSDKSLAQVREDIEVILRQRQVDSISVAGGDPLVYPHIVEVVRMIRHDFGKKPILNTNGLALTEPLLKQLVDAGLFGFTFHVDSSQGRPGWKDKDEIQLNELRLQLATMVRRAGDLSVAFNATIFPHTLARVPALADWARDHIDLVDTMVFILFRTARTDEFDYFAGARKVTMDTLVYHDMDKNPEPLRAERVVEVLQANDPDFRPTAYLGGTRDPDSFKWLLTSRLGVPGTIYGYLGPRSMELAQTAHHAANGRYLAYLKPSSLRHGRSMMWSLFALDRGARKSAFRWLRTVATRPLRAAQRVHFQTVLIIQPIDMMADGEANMCDGCPDMTVHDGELVWSCRLDERTQHGCFLRCVPKEASLA